METVEHEASRRAADAANGCAQKPKPAGRPRDLVLAVLRRGPATKSEIREATALSNADTKSAISSLMRDGSIWSRDGKWCLR